MKPAIRSGFKAFRLTLVSRIDVLDKLKRRLLTMGSEETSDDDAYRHLETIRAYAQDIVDMVQELEKTFPKEVQSSRNNAPDRSKRNREEDESFYQSLR